MPQFHFCESKNNVVNIEIIMNKNAKFFGYIWSAIFLIIAYKNSMNAVFLSLAGGFFLCSCCYPEIFLKTRLLQAWIKIGDFLGKINSKIIIFILFFFIFTPIGLLLKIFNKDLLSKKLDKTANTYFKLRETPPTDMKNQF